MAGWLSVITLILISTTGAVLLTNFLPVDSNTALKDPSEWTLIDRARAWHSPLAYAALLTTALWCALSAWGRRWGVGFIAGIGVLTSALAFFTGSSVPWYQVATELEDRYGVRIHSGTCQGG